MRQRAFGDWAPRDVGGGTATAAHEGQEDTAIDQGDVEPRATNATTATTATTRTPRLESQKGKLGKRNGRFDLGLSCSHLAGVFHPANEVPGLDLHVSPPRRLAIPAAVGRSAADASVCGRQPGEGESGRTEIWFITGDRGGAHRIFAAGGWTGGSTTTAGNSGPPSTHTPPSS